MPEQLLRLSQLANQLCAGGELHLVARRGERLDARPLLVGRRGSRITGAFTRGGLRRLP